MHEIGENKWIKDNQIIEQRAKKEHIKEIYLRVKKQPKFSNRFRKIGDISIIKSKLWHHSL